MNGKQNEPPFSVAPEVPSHGSDSMPDSQRADSDSNSDVDDAVNGSDSYGDGDSDAVRDTSADTDTADVSDSEDHPDTETVTTPLAPIQLNSFQINQNTFWTTTPQVRLYIDVENAAEMRVKNADGEWTPWKQVVAMQSWVLPDMDGEHVVFAEFRNDFPSLATANARIQLDRVPPDAPLVTLVDETPTSNAHPLWEWTVQEGGNGVFRVKIDNENLNLGAIELTEMQFSPSVALGNGLHTLYVQERDDAGNWSASGTAVVYIDTEPPQVTKLGRGSLYCSYMFGSSVAIYNDATDALTDVEKMRYSIRASESDAHNWTAWMPWMSSVALSGFTVGVNYLTAEFVEACDNKASISKLLILDDGFDGCIGNNHIAASFDLDTRTNYEEGSLLNDFSDYGTPYALDRDFFTFVVPRYTYVYIEVNRISGPSVLKASLLNSGGGEIDSVDVPSQNEYLALNNCDNPNEMRIYISVNPVTPGTATAYNIYWFEQDDGCM